VDLRIPKNFYCATGGRSSYAMKIISGMGFDQVYEIICGISGLNE